MYGERCDLGAMENLAIELGFEVAGRGECCLEELPLVAAKRVGLKARDRPVADAGVVVLPVRKTPDAVEKVGFFWGGVGRFEGSQAVGTRMVGAEWEIIAVGEGRAV